MVRLISNYSTKSNTSLQCCQLQQKRFMILKPDIDDAISTVVKFSEITRASDAVQVCTPSLSKRVNIIQYNFIIMVISLNYVTGYRMGRLTHLNCIVSKRGQNLNRAGIMR